ncbi:PEP-CTERM sorting domain-containing protein [Thiocystis violascens]|uniref:PEP-CTERM putative exosortase interaction domain-containing protein n=1 Tax=Thiocystis violascens (strain ATCC 17096 / DSM 198 / 6111) TaxID=765911 RepID=I3YA38_THIV6|nr:PEP-CTERM sorting domain-containing protein [Thiocystis violascens]AFL73856.1 PEP-CTERM putative exosortase interaction domain-containing protein [Thiocystis violascens DSM 198]
MNRNIAILVFSCLASINTSAFAAGIWFADTVGSTFSSTDGTEIGGALIVGWNDEEAGLARSTFDTPDPGGNINYTVAVTGVGGGYIQVSFPFGLFFNYQGGVFGIGPGAAPPLGLPGAPIQAPWWVKWLQVNNLNQNSSFWADSLVTASANGDFDSQQVSDGPNPDSAYAEAAASAQNDGAYCGINCSDPLIEYGIEFLHYMSINGGAFQEIFSVDITKMEEDLLPSYSDWLAMSGTPESFELTGTFNYLIDASNFPEGQTVNITFKDEAHLYLQARIVPEPSVLPLLSVGLISLVGIRQKIWRKRLFTAG